MCLGHSGSGIKQNRALLSGTEAAIKWSCICGSVQKSHKSNQKTQVCFETQMLMRHTAQYTVSLWCGAGRAAAAAGQSGLMALYDSLFGLMDCQAAQILVTSNDFADADFRKNLSATTEDLLSMNVVPVFNENDAISSRTAAEVVRPWLTCDSFVAL